MSVLIRHEFMHKSLEWGEVLRGYKLLMVGRSLDTVICEGTRVNVNAFMHDYFPAARPYTPTEMGNADE